MSWDESVDISGHPEAYRRALEAAAEQAGTDESVFTGRGTVHGRAVVVLANEFQFLAGSIGSAARTLPPNNVGRARGLHGGSSRARLWCRRVRVGGP